LAKHKAENGAAPFEMHSGINGGLSAKLGGMAGGRHLIAAYGAAIISALA